MIDTFPSGSVIMPVSDSLTGSVQYLPYKVTDVPANLLKTYPHSKRVGHYLLGRTLGEGSFAKVKEGMHILTGEKVAVKIIDKKKAKEDAYVRKNLRREGKLLQQIRHSNVIQLHEVMETENSYYLVTELCEGGDLMDYICSKRHLEERETRRFIRQIISAVDYLHKTGILHRDLKIENLLLDENKDIKIIDFGLSNSVRVGNTLTGSQQEFCVTQCGSPAYAAPELLSNKKYGPKVDIWSIGVNMYAMLTGNLPFTVEPFNIKALHSKMLNADMNPFPSHLSSTCKDLMKKFLTPDPEYRISLNEAMQHPWINEGRPRPMEPAPFPNRVKSEDLDQCILRHMSQNMDYKVSEIVRMACNNTPSNVCATYRLLHKRLTRYNAEMRVKGRVAASDARVIADNNKAAVTSKKRDESSPKVTAGEIIDLIPIQHTDTNSRPVRTLTTHATVPTPANRGENTPVKEMNNNDTMYSKTESHPSPTTANKNAQNSHMTARMNAYRLSKRKTERKELNSNSAGTGVTTETFKIKQTAAHTETNAQEKLFTVNNGGSKRREEIGVKNRRNSQYGNEQRLATTATPHGVIHKRIAQVAEQISVSDEKEAGQPQDSTTHDLPEIVRRYSCLKENGMEEVIKEDETDVENNNNNTKSEKYTLFNMSECKEAIRRNNVANTTRTRKLKSGVVKATATPCRSPSPGSLNRAKTLPLDGTISLKYSSDNHTRVSVKSLSKQGRKVVDLSLYDRYARRSIKTLPSVFNSQKIFNGKRASDTSFSQQPKRPPMTLDATPPIKKSVGHIDSMSRDFHEKELSESRDSGIVCNAGAEKSTKLTSLRRSPMENALTAKPSNENKANSHSSRSRESTNITLSRLTPSDELGDTKDFQFVLPSISPPLTYR